MIAKPLTMPVKAMLPVKARASSVCQLALVTMLAETPVPEPCTVYTLNFT